MPQKILVLVSGYPSQSNLYNCSWAHTRNRYYIEQGLSLDVYVPDVGVSYEIDGVNVISKEQFNINLKTKAYTLIISHSPNIRKHLPIMKNLQEIKKILFMHGTESMSLNNDYPKPYRYMETGLIKSLLRDCYDHLKFKALKKFILKNKNNINMVFVSDWMKDIFCKNIFLLDKTDVKYSIIHNSLNNNFIERNFINDMVEPVADFVTLRSLDLSKYAIDMVVNLAIANPKYSFHIYGKGNYFSHNERPENVTVFNYHIPQDEICDLLSKYRCALMPTRCDAQGVMACEIATYGMPMVTTDISINRDMFSSFKNVKLLTETEFNNPINIELLSENISISKNEKFSKVNTLNKEIALILSTLSTEKKEIFK